MVVFLCYYSQTSTKQPSVNWSPFIKPSLIKYQTQDGNGLKLEKLWLKFSSCFRAPLKKSMLMAMVCKLRLYFPLDVKR